MKVALLIISSLMFCIGCQPTKTIEQYRQEDIDFEAERKTMLDRIITQSRERCDGVFIISYAYDPWAETEMPQSWRCEVAPASRHRVYQCIIDQNVTHCHPSQ